MECLKFRSKSYAFEAAAGATTAPDNFVVPKGKGRIVGLEVFVDNNVLATVADAFITIGNNGSNIIESAPLLKFSSIYANTQKPIPVDLPESSEVNFSVTNNSGTAINVIVNFVYYKEKCC